MFVGSGTYSWNGEENALIFNNDPEQKYLVKENILVVLNKDGEEIKGDLIHLFAYVVASPESSIYKNIHQINFFFFL